MAIDRDHLGDQLAVALAVDEDGDRANSDSSHAQNMIEPSRPPQYDVIL